GREPRNQNRAHEFWRASFPQQTRHPPRYSEASSAALPTDCLRGPAVPEVRAGRHTHGPHAPEPGGCRRRPESRRRCAFRPQRAPRTEESRWPTVPSTQYLVPSTPLSDESWVLSTGYWVL